MDVQELVSSYLGQEDWRVNENLELRLTPTRVC